MSWSCHFPLTVCVFFIYLLSGLASSSAVFLVFCFPSRFLHQLAFPSTPALHLPLEPFPPSSSFPFISLTCTCAVHLSFFQSSSSVSLWVWFLARHGFQMCLFTSFLFCFFRSPPQYFCKNFGNRGFKPIGVRYYFRGFMSDIIS